MQSSSATEHDPLRPWVTQTTKQHEVDHYAPFLLKQNKNVKTKTTHVKTKANKTKAAKLRDEDDDLPFESSDDDSDDAAPKTNNPASDDSGAQTINLASKIGAGMFIDASLVAQPIPEMGGGRGVVAMKNLRPDALVAAVPYHLIATPAKARRQLRLPPSTPAITAIAFLLIHERRAHELRERGLLAQTQTSASTSGADPASFTDAPTGYWAPWVSRLPPRYDNLLEIEDALPVAAVANEDPWDAHPDMPALAATLVPGRRYAAKVEEEVRHWRQMGRGAFERYVYNDNARRPVLDQSDDERRLPTKILFHHMGVFTRRDDVAHWRWAFNSLMSRGFAFDGCNDIVAAAKDVSTSKSKKAAASAAVNLWRPGEKYAYDGDGQDGSEENSPDDDVWCMQPWVDYFNYATDPNIAASFNTQRAQFEFRVVDRDGNGRGIAQGEQLCLCYGNYTDFELALWYGFALCSPPKTERANDDDHDAADDAAEKQATCEAHQEHCAYAFSPLADTDGNYPNGTKWVRELAASAFARFYHSQNAPSSSESDACTVPAKDIPLELRQQGLRAATALDMRALFLEGASARVSRTSVTPELARLVRAVARAILADQDNVTKDKRAETVGMVLRCIIGAELASFQAAATTSSGGDVALATTSNDLPVLQFAACVKSDSEDLLRTLLARSNRTLSRMVELA